MTTANRSVITTTTVFTLVAYVILLLLVHTKDAAALEYEEPTTNETARHRDTESTTIGDHRQDRVSLPSKAKREQALRSILAARRRQILSQRPVESRAARPIEASKESDVLEAQETRHGVYVTTAANGKDDEEGNKGKEASEPAVKDRESKINSTSPPSNAQKSSDSDARKKKIVPMPESLYNYFRPVESNIPIEDMSQFLYFGQKIQNTTGNNSVETAGGSTTASSRRRYSMKRFTVTTPVSQSEEIVNDEMNIAVERQTVERNKVSRMKNVFRTPENGVHYRKKSTVVTKENRTEIEIPDNSAHAESQLRVEGAHAETRNSTQIPEPIARAESENREDESKSSTPVFNPESMEMYDEQKRIRGTPRESNNIETSTSRDKLDRTIWPETSTLRIIVTEGTAAGVSTVKPVDPLGERVRLAPGQQYSDKTFGNEDPHRRREQQQHVYAYTITNVTRLLRNYTGPGLSRVGQGGLTGGSEISGRPSPTEIPPAGSGTEASGGEPTAGSSAGTTVGRDGGRDPGARQVGELARKPAAGGQSQERAGAGRSSQQLTAVNKDGPRPPGQELSHRGAARWNRTDLEGFGRVLRKSASAVLNQRAVEEGTAAKRRRPTNVARGGKYGDMRSYENSTAGGLQAATESSTEGSTPSPTEENSTAVNIADDENNDTKESAASGETTTVAVTETIAPNEVTPKEIATMPAPVFPVTPKIVEPVQTAGNQTFTPESGKNEKRVVDLSGMDPSEIQKMYRSKDAATTTSTTTVTSDEGTTEISTIQDETTTDSMGPETSTPPIEPERKSSERSPEVRGRNLSDESQDSKDDVLPIMHLYNTSNIFNGTGPMNSISRGTERRPELPDRVNNTVNETVPKNHAAETPSNSSRVTEARKQEDGRNETNAVPPTGPGRGSQGNNRTRHRPAYHHAVLPEYNSSVYSDEFNRTFLEAGLISVSPRESVNISEVISKRHDGDAIASQETVAVVSYILATLLVFPIAVGVGIILRRLILRNRKVLEESDTSSEISCRKDALNLENGDFKTSIEKAITKLPRIQHLCHEAEKPPPPSSQESKWEFPRDKLRLQTVLGQGNFGQVWKAEADDLTGHQGTTRLVAVKTVKEGASDREKEDLVRELEIMQQLGSHPNVVTLLGCCTEQEPHYLILEYVMYGKLLAYLRDHRTRQDFYNFSEDSAALTSRDLTVFAYCVARGMEYLASKKIIHRDLAARNVLVDHNKLCKIADFGMSRFANEDGEVIETRHGRNALPIRWMAPESLIYSLFTTKTDVWSFGILMWEIVTLGSTPYPDMTAREVMRNVQNGYRLERPSHCRSELFRVISRCWHADPDRRSEFQALRRDLAQLLEDNMNGHYVDLESFASESTD